jgi:hypothetical protein
VVNFAARPLSLLKRCQYPLGGSHRRSRHFKKEINPLKLSAVKKQVPGHPALSPVTTPTELSRLVTNGAVIEKQQTVKDLKMGH